MLMLLFSGSERTKHIAVLDDQLKNQPLLPSQSTRPVLIAPSRTGPMSGTRCEHRRPRCGTRRLQVRSVLVRVSPISASPSIASTRDALPCSATSQRDSNGHLRHRAEQLGARAGRVFDADFEGLDWRGRRTRKGGSILHREMTTARLSRGSISRLHAELIHHARLASPVHHRSPAALPYPRASGAAPDRVPSDHTDSTPDASTRNRNHCL